MIVKDAIDNGGQTVIDETIDAKKKLTGMSLFKTLLTSFSIVAIISCMSIGLLTYYLRANGIRSRQYRLLETLRDEKIENISTWLKERSGDVAVMVKRRNVIAFCEKPVSSKAEGMGKVLTALSTMRKAYRYEDVFLFDIKGDVIVSTERESHQFDDLFAREKSLQRTIKEKVRTLSDVLICKAHNRPFIFLFAPIFSSESVEMIGVLGVMMDPFVWLYPEFSRSGYLSDTGEILLVNSEGLVQSPLQYRSRAIASVAIDAKPALLGASGAFGIISTDDYRHEPVTAAYGHIKEFNWGIVVKQDVSEVNVPVRIMALNVAGVSLGVLFFALICGVVISMRISRPALRIAHVASMIGRGDFDVQVEVEGPLEIQEIAMNVNIMAKELALRFKASQGVRKIVTVAGKHNRTAELLKEILPVIMEATCSRLGVVYMVGVTGHILEQALVRGIGVEFMPREITIDPPSHLLAESLKLNQVQVFATIPDNDDVIINTDRGGGTPSNFLCIPIILRDNPIGVIGLSSVNDYDKATREIIDGMRTSLAQAFEVCSAFEISDRMRAELNTANKDLTLSNEDLRMKSEALKKQADELRRLAVELEVERQQVVKADQLKSTFLSNMSHELRTPLNSVLSLSQLMLGSAEGEDKDQLEIIERNARLLLNLINDILDLSKIESGKMDLFVSSFSAVELIDAVVASIRPLIDDKGLLITVDAENIDDIHSDSKMLQQILLNLLSNAQKFTEKGKIAVKVSQEERSIIFNISDTGCGISKKDLAFIFDEFRQADGSIKRQHGGTGLGLAICEHLTALLGGEIAVQSELGKGTTFTLTLPMVITSDGEVLTHDEAEGARDIKKLQPGVGMPDMVQKKSGRVTVLLVDDNVDNLRTTRGVLKNMNIEIIEASTGEEAVAVSKDRCPDIVFMDIQLPGMDGLEATRLIKQERKSGSVVVIALTALAMIGNKEEILAAGCDDYLSKPVQPSTLKTMLQKWIEGVTG